jgi:hypothetical protein
MYLYSSQIKGDSQKFPVHIKLPYIRGFFQQKCILSQFMAESQIRECWRTGSNRFIMISRATNLCACCRSFVWWLLIASVESHPSTSGRGGGRTVTRFESLEPSRELLPSCMALGNGGQSEHQEMIGTLCAGSYKPPVFVHLNALCRYSMTASVV